MKIDYLKPDQWDEFFRFNQKMNPTRNDVIPRLKFQIFDNPLLKDRSHPNILVACDDQGKIIGQHLHNPFEYHFRGQCHQGFYGFDFYVLKSYRGKGIGSAIARKSRDEFFPHFGVGVSEASKKIHLALDNKIIGNLFIFIWIRNIFSPIRWAISAIAGKKRSLKAQFDFPPEQEVNDDRFKLIESIDRWNYQNWAENVLEFSRSAEFINWRFLSQQQKYACYRLQNVAADSYFVVRKIYTRGLKLLAIVDYRIPFADKEKFQKIIYAAKRLAKRLRFDGVFTMSSHRFFDDMLKKNRFIKIGRPIHIMTNAKLEFSRQQIDERNCVYATMAESDLDYYFE